MFVFFSIPLKRIKPLRETMKANGEWEDYLKLKQRLAMAKGPDEEPLKDYTDVSSCITDSKDTHLL